MDRFRKEEITLERIFSAIKRRVDNFPHLISWMGWNKNFRSNAQKLLRYKNTHNGKRCFIIGNGPSLKGMDLRILNDEFTFGLNRIYLLFKSANFIPTYYVSVNEQVLSQFCEDINEIDIPKFLDWKARRYFPDSSTINFVNLGLGIRDSFGEDLIRPISSGGTVTYVALQIAYWMGFQEAVLIGVDHNFSEKGTPNKLEVRTQEVDESHFDPNYFPKGVTWQLPDLLRSELAYGAARAAYEKDGRRILDATVGGKLTVFPKVDFESLFEKQ